MSPQQTADAGLSALVRIDRSCTGADLVELGFMSRVISGELPHVASLYLDQEIAPNTLLDDTFLLQRTTTATSEVAVFAERPDAGVLILVSALGTVVRVAAPTLEAAQSVATLLRERVEPERTDVGTSVRVWHDQAGRGVHVGRERTIDTPRWADIAANYPATVRSRLDWLHSLVEPVGAGKLILWRGEPGTGKTTAARALFRTWAPWCAVEYISDPERFFADPGYISEVIGRPTSRRTTVGLDHVERARQSWRVVVAEDTDDYLRAGSTQTSSAGLGRLLNLADGILGQGINTILLLTTNEPVDRLHPALVRPGRALAHIEFTRFDRAEATAWLGDTGVAAPTAGATLAELFHLRAGAQGGGIGVSTPASTGQYL